MVAKPLTRKSCTSSDLASLSRLEKGTLPLGMASRISFAAAVEPFLPL